MVPANRKEFADIRDIANEIRARVEQRYQAPARPPEEDDGYQASFAAGDFVPPRMFRAGELAGLVRSGQALAGNLPPVPPTLRGRVGRFLVAAVSRALFWYTPQIQAFQRMSAEAVREQADAVDVLSREVAQLRAGLEGAVARVHALDRRNSELREMLARLNRDSALQAQSQNYAESLAAEPSKALPEMLSVVDAQAKSAFAEALASSGLLQRVDAINTALAELDRTASRHGEAEKTVDLLSGRVEAINAALAELDQTASRRSEAESALDRVSGRVEAISAALAELNEALAQRKEAEALVYRLRSEVAVQARRLDGLFLEVRRGRQPEPSLPPQEPADSSGDLWYSQFEDAFRGTRADIKSRLGVYLERLAAPDSGKPLEPVLDIGCGRAEWLELLAENGIKARGIDVNRVFVEEARVRGFDAVLADGLSYLKTLPEASVGAVTAFHVIEHLEFPQKLELLDGALRILKPGGLLILETPNPENVLVSTKTFYYDPSHRQPVPADFLKFLVEARGYCAPEVVPMHPYPKAIHIDEQLGPLAAFLNYYFYGCQDYALLARKV